MSYKSFEEMPVWKQAMDLEGFGRKHIKDKLNFYYDARGSLSETRSHLIYGQCVGYFTLTELEEYGRLIDNIWRELNSLIATLRLNY